MLLLKVRTERRPRIVEMQKQGVAIVNYGKDEVIECLAQQFPIEQHYVWLEKSKTLGLELRVVQPDTLRDLAALILRPDGTALIRGERDFSRTVDTPEGYESTFADFLHEVAKAAIIGLPAILY